MKTPSKEVKQIIVCSECQVPLIWTFMWDYNEYFCINCGGHWGMMGAGDRVEEAPELKKLKKTINKVWKSVSKYLLPRSHNYTRSNCKKCLVDRCHPHHLSKREMREDRIATSILRNLKGSFN